MCWKEAGARDRGRKAGIRASLHLIINGEGGGVGVGAERVPMDSELAKRYCTLIMWK